MRPPIPAIPAIRPVLTWQPGGSLPQQQVGDLLSLRVEVGAQGELLARDGRGLLLSLPAETAVAGDVLLLRVLSSQPKLALELVERQPSTPALKLPVSEENESPAVRTDQAWLQRLQVAGLNSLPASLAAQWRNRVLAEVLRAGRSAASIADLPPAAQGQLLLPAQHQSPIHLLGWNAQALLLRLLGVPPDQARHGAADEAAADGGAAQDEGARDSGGLQLLFGLSLNGEWVQLRLHWQHGLFLHFSADKPQTLQALRGLMPRMAAALAAVPLLMRHCQLSLKPPPGTPLSVEQQARGLAHSSSGALFRAAAEIARILQQGQHPT